MVGWALHLAVDRTHADHLVAVAMIEAVARGEAIEAKGGCAGRVDKGEDHPPAQQPVAQRYPIVCALVQHAPRADQRETGNSTEG